ncbi:MAG: DUF835 domain-containing protein [Candidatus Bathyarchaeia archaeon]
MNSTPDSAYSNPFRGVGVDDVHSLLKHQLTSIFGDNFRIPKEWQKFVIAVNNVYREFDTDRQMLEYSLELNSKQLRESEGRLAHALDAAELGIWSLDTKTGKIWRSLRHDHIFGYRVLLPEWSYQIFLDHVLPEDRKGVDEEFGQALTTRREWNFDCRIRRTNGDVRWIWMQGKPRLSDQGEVVQMVGLVKDITERKLAEEEVNVLSKNESKMLIQKIRQVNNMAKVRETLRMNPQVTGGMEMILGSCLKDLEVDVGAIFRVDREKNTAKLQACKSKLESIKIADSYPLDSDYAELEPVSSGRKVSKAITQNVHSILGTGNIHSFPIRSGKTVYGILAFGSEKGLERAEVDLAILELYAETTSPIFEAQRLSVTPVKESKRLTRKFELEVGELYLVKNDVDKAFRIFADNVLSGSAGLCITRQYPIKVRKRYGLEKTTIIWLTQEQSQEKTIHSIQDIAILISNFLGKAKHAVVMLDGVEYLITNYGFDSFVRFLQQMNNRVAQNEAILIAPVYEKALEERYIKLVERETTPLTIGELPNF